MKKYLLPIAGLLFIALLGFAIDIYKEAFKKSTAALTAYRVNQDSTTYYRDLYGREHAQRLQVQADNNTLRQLYRQTMDSIAAAIGTKAKNIRQAAAVGVLQSFTARSGTVDTVYAAGKRPVQRFTYNDRWVRITATLSDTPSVSYQNFDSLIVATYMSRTGLFKKRMYINAYSLNPNSHITGLTGFEVSVPPPKRWVIGPCISYIFDGTQWRFGAGAAISYSLIRF